MVTVSFRAFHEILGTLPGPKASISVTRMRALSLVAAMACAACCVRAQNASPQPMRYPISGSVYNSATGEPVRRALVKAFASGAQLYAFTGGDGRFEIDAVPEGMVTITAERPGYLNSQMNGQPQPSSFKVGPGTNDFRIPLQPAARLSGTIVDPDGEPVEGVSVQVEMDQIMNGRKQRQTRGSSATDDTGTYRMEDLPPGEAYISTGSRPLLPGQVYLARYYPDAEDAATAQPVQLGAGQEAQANFTLRPAKAFSVSGVVTGLPSGQWPMTWLENAAGERQFQGQMRFDPTHGRFTVLLAPVGVWTLHFQANDHRGSTLEADQPITVTDADIRGLQVLMKPAITIPVEVNNAAPVPMQTGNVTFISGSTNFATGFRSQLSAQVSLVPENNWRNEQYYSQYRSNAIPDPAQAPDENRPPPPLEIPGVRPGKYQVHVQAIGMQQCVDTVTSGSTDLTRNPLIVADGAEPPPIVVNMRNDCGGVMIVAHSDEQNASAILLLFPPTPVSDPLVQYLQADGKTAAMLSNLTPGEYRVYAFSNADGLEYMNPEALRDFSPETVTVEPNGRANITVNVIQRGSKN